MVWLICGSRVLAPQIEADQGTLHVGQIADDLADRVGQLLHKGRDRHDLMVLRQPRIGKQIDDLDLVAAGQVFLADLLEVAEGGQRLRRLPRGVQPQLPFLVWAALYSLRAFGAHLRFLFPFPCVGLPASPSRRFCAAVLSSIILCSRVLSWVLTSAASSSTDWNSSPRAAICASSAARRPSSSRCLRSSSCSRARAAAFSRSSWAARIEPVRTPSPPT